MTAVMIGAGPHKGSHTAVAIGAAEEPLGRLRVRASAGQAQRLVAWAAAWPERTWAVEGAGGLGHLLAQQLVAAGERVLDVQPKLGARVRLLATGRSNKNDPNGALSVAVAALRSRTRRQVSADDYAAVLRVWSRRHRDLGRAKNQVARRLHAVLCELVPGGVPEEITAAQATRILCSAKPAGAAGQARCELAAELLDDMRQMDTRIREAGEEARRRGPRIGHHGHRDLRGRPGHRRDRDRRRRRRGPVRQPRSLPGSPGALLHRGPLRTAHARSRARGPSKPLGRFRWLAVVARCFLLPRRPTAAAGRSRVRGVSGSYVRWCLAGCRQPGSPP
jgi:hypothetical protein